MDSRRARRSFEPTPSAPGLSRRFVREMLDVWDADDLVATAELLTSELVSNVVRHAVSTVGLELAYEDATLRVEVRDGSSIVPALRDMPGEDGGFGLRLIDALVRDWGVTATDDGKAVWFTVDRASAQGSGS